MSISTEEKDRYLRETAIVLAREGFQTGKTDTGKLRVLLDGAPLCEVTENGGITYRNEDINEPERVAAKDMVYEIVRNTAEYMWQMETAPFLKADGLEDGYKVLADFNGTVLAGVQSKHGVHFVTWDWAYGHTGVCHGHYFMENYAGAKQDFATAESPPKRRIRQTAMRCRKSTIPIKSCPTPLGRWQASLRTRASPEPRPRSARTSCG